MHCNGICMGIWFRSIQSFCVRPPHLFELAFLYVPLGIAATVATVPSAANGAIPNCCPDATTNPDTSKTGTLIFRALHIGIAAVLLRPRCGRTFTTSTTSAGALKLSLESFNFLFKILQ